MLDGSINPKTYRLLNLTTDTLPGILHERCASGLERLKLTLDEGKYYSYGTYLKSGEAISVRCLDGSLSRQGRLNVVDLVSNVSEHLVECTGYYFSHQSDEGESSIVYSTYFYGL